MFEEKNIVPLSTLELLYRVRKIEHIEGNRHIILRLIRRKLRVILYEIEGAELKNQEKIYAALFILFVKYPSIQNVC